MFEVSRKKKKAMQTKYEVFKISANMKKKNTILSSQPAILDYLCYTNFAAEVKSLLTK